MADMVNDPPHYTRFAITPVDAIECWGLGFNLGNTVKYIARAEYKGAALEDLKKARWYLDREIALREKIASEWKPVGANRGESETLANELEKK